MTSRKAPIQKTLEEIYNAYCDSQEAQDTLSELLDKFEAGQHQIPKSLFEELLPEADEDLAELRAELLKGCTLTYSAPPPPKPASTIKRKRVAKK
jgi:hypothetical protein